MRSTTRSTVIFLFASSLCGSLAAPTPQEGAVIDGVDGLLTGAQAGGEAAADAANAANEAEAGTELSSLDSTADVPTLPDQAGIPDTGPPPPPPDAPGDAAPPVAPGAAGDAGTTPDAAAGDAADTATETATLGGSNNPDEIVIDGSSLGGSKFVEGLNENSEGVQQFVKVKSWDPKAKFPEPEILDAVGEPVPKGSVRWWAPLSKVRAPGVGLQGISRVGDIINTVDKAVGFIGKFQHVFTILGLGATIAVTVVEQVENNKATDALLAQILDEVVSEGPGSEASQAGTTTPQTTTAGGVTGGTTGGTAGGVTKRDDPPSGTYTYVSKNGTTFTYTDDDLNALVDLPLNLLDDQNNTIATLQQDLSFKAQGPMTLVTCHNQNFTGNATASADDFPTARDQLCSGTALSTNVNGATVTSAVAPGPNCHTGLQAIFLACNGIFSFNGGTYTNGTESYSLTST